MKRLLATALTGDPDAQFNLGVMYDNRIDDTGNAVRPTDDNGYAIDGNRAEAMKWLLRAAEQGLPRAQTRLAELYAEEPDAKLNRVKACQWFILAKDKLNGFRHERAQAGYDRISTLMTQDQIALAERRAKTWQRKWRKEARLASSRILAEATP